MLKNHIDYSFAQNIIADINNVSPSTITRLIKEMNLESVSPVTSKIKKYSLSDTQLLSQKLQQPHEIIKKTHVFYNMKGGTGKTSICAQIASHLSIVGYKVLLIDCDPQAHMTSILGFPEGEDYMTIYDVIVNNVSIDDAKINVMAGLDAVLSNLSLSRVEVPLSQKNRREEKLLGAISEIENHYDFIMIDTNPSFSNLNLNALYCANQINLICETAPFSLYGLRVMLEETISFFNDMNRTFDYRIIPNKYESKTATAQEVLGYLRAHYKENVMDSIVRKCEDINIASKECKPLSTFCKRKSIAFEDIMDLFHEFIGLSTKESKAVAA